MSDAIKICLKHEFSWMKKDFFFLNGLIILSALLCQLLPVNEVVVLVVTMFLVVKSFMFMHSYSLSPGQGDSFSWKFLQGLPLNKIDLIKMIVISGALSTFPFFLFFVLFWNFISKVLLTVNYNIFHVAVNLIFIFTFFMIYTVYAQIQYPRKEFQKKNATNTLVKSVRIYLTMFVLFSYGLIFLIYIENTYGIHLLHYLIIAGERVIEKSTSWWSVPLLLLGNYFLYEKTLNVWINEKLSYKKNLWNPKKEYSVIVGSLCLLSALYSTIDFTMPDIYTGRVNSLVYKKKYKELEQILTKENRSKWTNIYGMNPMLVALNEGNLDMVKFLESKGLTFDGRIMNKKSKRYGFDAFMFAVNSGNVPLVDYLLSKNFKSNQYNELSGYYPIHSAAFLCRPKIVDLLVKNGADINVLNAKGETPLIVAVRGKCVLSVVSLNEAGARFDIADKSGKTALDHMKGIKDYDNLQYYVEKHSRLPASELK